MNSLRPAHEYADEFMKVVDNADRFTRLATLIETIQQEAYDAGERKGKAQLLMIASASAERSQVPVPAPPHA